MSDNTPIYDAWAAEFFAERGFRVESLFAPTPKPEPVQRVIPKPGAVIKSVKGMRPAGVIVDEWISSDVLEPQETSESLFDKERLAAFPKVGTLFDKPGKTPYRSEKTAYTGADTQPIDVSFLRTSKTLQPLE